MRTRHRCRATALGRAIAALFLGIFLVASGAVGQELPAPSAAPSEPPNPKAKVPDPQLRTLLPKLGLDWDVAICLLTSAIRQAGLLRDTTQLEKVRQWCSVACAYPDAPEIIKDPDVAGDLIKAAILAMGRLGAGDELPSECVQKHPLLAQVARARTLADRAVPVANTPKKWQQKVEHFFKEVSDKRDDFLVLAELLSMAREAYEAGVRDAFELCGVDWSRFQTRVQVAKMPQTERIRWLVEQIGKAEVGRNWEHLLLQLLIDEGSAAIEPIYAELERYKEAPQMHTGLSLLITALACIACMDEKALQVLEKVAQFPSEKLSLSAQLALEQYRRRSPDLKPFLGCAPLPAHLPAKFYP